MSESCELNKFMSVNDLQITTMLYSPSDLQLNVVVFFTSNMFVTTLVFICALAGALPEDH